MPPPDRSLPRSQRAPEFGALLNEVPGARSLPLDLVELVVRFHHSTTHDGPPRPEPLAFARKNHPAARAGANSHLRLSRIASARFIPAKGRALYLLVDARSCRAAPGVKARHPVHCCTEF